MARDKGQLDLRKDIRDALDLYVPEDVPESATTAILTVVLPHFELAYKRGLAAAESRAGYRVVQENEKLRRELKQASELAEARQRVIERMAREAMGPPPVNRRVRKAKEEET